MDNINDLIPYIIPDVPGAPEGVIKLRLREAMRQFCRETEAWTEDIEVNEVADQADYDVVPSYEAYIKRIVHIKIKSSGSNVFDSMVEADPSQYKLNNDALSISFYDGYEPQNTVTNGIQVRVALMPNVTVEEFSGKFLDRYAEGVYSLAKHMLMRTPRTPYYAPDLARFYYTEYEVAKSNAMKEKETENKNVNAQIQQMGGIL